MTKIGQLAKKVLQFLTIANCLLWLAYRRMRITKIQIQNFRSIKSETISPSEFSVFVGQTQPGKS